MEQSRVAPGSHQRFKKQTSKNSKKEKTSNRGREEDDEEDETGSRRDNEKNLTDFLCLWIFTVICETCVCCFLAKRNKLIFYYQKLTLFA